MLGSLSMFLRFSNGSLSSRSDNVSVGLLFPVPLACTGAGRPRPRGSEAAGVCRVPSVGPNPDSWELMPNILVTAGTPLSV